MPPRHWSVSHAKTVFECPSLIRFRGEIAWTKDREHLNPGKGSSSSWNRGVHPFRLRGPRQIRAASKEGLKAARSGPSATKPPLFAARRCVGHRPLRVVNPATCMPPRRWVRPQPPSDSTPLPTTSSHRENQRPPRAGVGSAAGERPPGSDFPLRPLHRSCLMKPRSHVAPGPTRPVHRPPSPLSSRAVRRTLQSAVARNQKGGELTATVQNTDVGDGKGSDSSLRSLAFVEDQCFAGRPRDP